MVRLGFSIKISSSHLHYHSFTLSHFHFHTFTLSLLHFHNFTFTEEAFLWSGLVSQLKSHLPPSSPPPPTRRCPPPPPPGLVSQLKSHLPTDQLDRPVWGLVIHGLATSELKKNCETNCTNRRTATSKYLPSESSFILFATHPSAEE